MVIDGRAVEAPATFPLGGVHPKELKDPTASLPIEPLPPPPRVCLFLKQHVGAACQVAVQKPVEKPPHEALLFGRHPGRIYQQLVTRKPRVSAGDPIGSVGDTLGAALHASIGGTVEGVVDALHPMTGKAMAIVISRDPEAVPPAYAVEEWRHLSRQELLDRIKAAGIVGLGGAGFPAHAKLDVPPDIPLDTLILNGAECEPYLTCDHRIMVEHPHEVVEGARIILTILGIRDCVIGVENNKPDAIDALRASIGQSRSNDPFRIAVTPLRVKYPQGSADQIIQSITGRVRPSGKRSSSIGVIVQNVYTSNTIYDAVARRKELIDDRRRKHPWDQPTAGSWFKNLPPAEPGGRRRPAGALLEAAGAKDMREGGAAVFARHANIIINAGGATSGDVLRLAERMRTAVREHFQIDLETEVRHLGPRDATSAPGATN